MMSSTRISVIAAASATALATLTAPAAAQAPAPASASAQAPQVGAKKVHRGHGKCINWSWGDGNVSTTIYFNNHCKQARWLKVWRTGQYWPKCIKVNGKTKGRKKLWDSKPTKIRELSKCVQQRG